MFLSKIASRMSIHSSAMLTAKRSMCPLAASRGLQLKNPAQLRYKTVSTEGVKPFHKGTVRAYTEGEEATEELVVDEGFEAFLENSVTKQRHVMLTKKFLKCAEELKDVFDSRFSDPRETHPERFLWDYWHVPKHYSLVRTAAHNYFPEELYQDLEDALINYGQEHLGCRACTQIWLSYYVDGHFQALHTDAPHGPWAFVLSLTDWENRKFEGGETMIMRPKVVDYWKNFDPTVGLETESMFQTVPPHFNQLTVFDPRLPHHVPALNGTRDPRHGRLVLHGWFTEPAPFFTGPLDTEEACEPLDDALHQLYADLAEAPPAFGVITVRLDVAGEDGKVKDLQLLTDTLISDPASGIDPVAARQEILMVIYAHLKAVKFPTASGDSAITLPFVFE